MSSPDPEPVLGPVDPAVRAELPGLRLWSVRVRASPGASTPGLRARLAHLADRLGGARAAALRREPVPRAYRVLFRHVGLDPDADRTPIEAAVLDRLLRGGLRSAGRLEDALTIALLETGVPVWALDAAHVAAPLALGLDGGRIVVADAAGPVCPLFAAPPRERAPGPATCAMVLFAVQPAGVSALHLEEALWLVAEALDGV